MISFPCAKINIGLHITARREDSYHDIETVFLPVQLNDVLEIIPSKNAEFSFTRTGINIPGKANDDLCVKAWEIINKNYNIEPINIHLQKNIPAGAGLGGGSADAAFTLLALNNIFNLNISEKNLKSFALQIGSDCPFFIKPQVSFAQGRGEILEPLNIDFPALKILIVIPQVHISTAKAFSLIKPQANRTSLKYLLQNTAVGEWKYQIKNDFEEALKTLFPYIQEFKNILYDNGAVYTSLSGSGSAVYGFFEDKIPENISSHFKNCKMFFV